MSAITLLGTPAEIYMNGTQYITLVASYPIVIFSTTKVYLPVFYKLGVSTSYEVLIIHILILIKNICTVEPYFIDIFE
jgi:sodium-coupled monocarboxylate transporter 8/12